MEELFADMQNKGLVQFTKKYMSYDAFELTKLVKLYDETLPIGEIEVECGDKFSPNK